MKEPKLTKHAKDQVDAMRPHVSLWDVVVAVRDWIAEHGLQSGGQTCVVIKDSGQRLEFYDGKGNCRHGDLIVAMIDKEDDSDQGRIVTVMPRGKQQKDRTFRPYSEIREQRSRWGK